MVDQNSSSSIMKALNVLLFCLHILFQFSKGDLTCPLPPELESKIQTDPITLQSAANDYGNIVHEQPYGVLNPLSHSDIISLINSSYNCTTPFGVSARGNGHSVHGQNMAGNGVVVNMKNLKLGGGGVGIRVNKQGMYADVGGEELWIDVMSVTQLQGVLPLSWTDFLYLSVGGTLSNAGISGQTFRFGPQITNVYELDLITGKGEVVTCSANNNPELFYSVLGGLGQFGIITRARIAVGPANNRARWARMLFSDFNAFTEAQEIYISRNGRADPLAVDYLEGQILFDNGTPNFWETAFFPLIDLPKITSLVQRYGIIYALEVATLYTGIAPTSPLNKRTHRLTNGLEAFVEYAYEVDVTYQEFLTRVPQDDPKIPPTSHPWLNLFVPKSKIVDFNAGVLRNIVLRRNISTGPVLFYPMNVNKFDDRMSAVLPNEDVFYLVALLYTAGVDDWQMYDAQNNDIVQFCENSGVNVKKYLPDYATKQDWINHFGTKWSAFESAKKRFDPKLILSPGQKIFTAS